MEARISGATSTMWVTTMAPAAAKSSQCRRQAAMTAIGHAGRKSVRVNASRMAKTSNLSHAAKRKTVVSPRAATNAHASAQQTRATTGRTPEIGGSGMRGLSVPTGIPATQAGGGSPCPWALASRGPAIPGSGSPGNYPLPNPVSAPLSYNGSCGGPPGLRRSDFSAAGQPTAARLGAVVTRQSEAVAPVATGTRRDRDEERLLTRRARSTVKLVARSLAPASADRRRLVLIFGCQRSGTTMLQQTMLDRSWRVFILEEHDRRLVGKDAAPDETLWDDVPVVLDRIRRLPFEVVAAKPLVESDRAASLLDAADNASGVWMLRHYRDVALSNLRRFGIDNAHRDLEPFVSENPHDWRSRRATEHTRRTVVDVLGAGLKPLDACAVLVGPQPALFRPGPGRR